MKVRISGALKSVSGGKVHSGGVSRELASIAYYDGSAVVELKRFVAALTVSPASQGAYVSRFGPGEVTSSPRTVTPSGGRAPYTYSWTRTSGGGSASSPFSATTTFTALLTNADSITGNFLCTVTDADGQQATSTAVIKFESQDATGDA